MAQRKRRQVVGLTLNSEDIALIDALATRQNRSRSSFMATVVLDYINKRRASVARREHDRDSAAQ